jgi:glycosyltransferase involved in cell wall biosynthesis
LRGQDRIDGDSQLRILLLHWGTKGGGPRFTLDMARGLTSIEDLELYCSISAYADNVNEWTTIVESPHVVKTYRNKLELITGLFRWIRAVASLRAYLRHQKVDIVFSGMMSLWQSIALPLLIPPKVKYVSSIHDALEHPGDEHWLKVLARRNEIRRADLIIGYSRHACNALEAQANPGQMVRELRLGTDEGAIAPRSLPLGRPIVLGFFGRLVEYKGIALFVETIRQLHQRGIPVVGQVFGNGELPEGLMDSSRDFVDWHVRWIDSRELNGIFKGFDILLLPYIEASQSGVLTQALQAALPIVATPVGGLKQQIEETRSGVLSENVSAEALADAVVKVCEDPELYRHLSQSAKSAQSGKFGWPAIARDLIDAVSELR